MQINASSLPISYNFDVILANVMVSCEIWQ